MTNDVCKAASCGYGNCDCETPKQIRDAANGGQYRIPAYPLQTNQFSPWDMAAIFDAQAHLNTYTLGKLGVVYADVIARGDQTWIENYRKALSAELTEFVEEDMENGITGNAQIEIVDMLHFLVSLSHFTNITWLDACKIINATHDTLQEDDMVLLAGPIALQMFLSLNDLMNATKWKWWAAGGGYDNEAAQIVVASLWCQWFMYVRYADMSLEQVYELYMAKNKVNFERQDNGYNEDTKTEDDNQRIVCEIVNKGGAE